MRTVKLKIDKNVMNSDLTKLPLCVRIEKILTKGDRKQTTKSKELKVHEIKLFS